MKQMKALECEHGLSGQALFFEDLWKTSGLSELYFPKLNVDEENMWVEKSNHTLLLITPILIEAKKMGLSKGRDFKDLLTLDFLVELSENSSLKTDLRDGLKEYLNVLPGYKKGALKQSEMAVSQHCYRVLAFFKSQD